MPKYVAPTKISAVFLLVVFMTVGACVKTSGSSQASAPPNSNQAAPDPSTLDQGTFQPGSPGASQGGSQAAVSPGTTQTFDQQLNAAEDILTKTPTGAQSLADFNTLDSNGNIDSVIPVLTINQFGHSGAIHEVSSGVYQLKLLATMSTDDLAQAFAHEVVHVKNEVAEDAYLATYPDLNIRFEGVAKHWDASLADYYASNKADVDFFFRSLAFEEVKAYSVNLSLEKEGIPFNNKGVKNLGILGYVQSVNLPANVTLAPLPSDFLQTVSKFANVADFEKAAAASQLKSP